MFMENQVLLREKETQRVTNGLLGCQTGAEAGPLLQRCLKPDRPSPLDSATCSVRDFVRTELRTMLASARRARSEGLGNHRKSQTASHLSWGRGGERKRPRSSDKVAPISAKPCKGHRRE